MVPPPAESLFLHGFFRDAVTDYAAPLYWPHNQKRRSKKLKNALAALTLYSKDSAGCVTDMAEHNLNVHSSLRELRRGSEKFDELFRYYGKKYSVAR